MSIELLALYLLLGVPWPIASLVAAEECDTQAEDPEKVPPKEKALFVVMGMSFVIWALWPLPAIYYIWRVWRTKDQRA